MNKISTLYVKLRTCGFCDGRIHRPMPRSMLPIQKSRPSFGCRPSPDVTCGAGKVLGGIPNVSVNGKTFVGHEAIQNLIHNYIFLRACFLLIERPTSTLPKGPKTRALQILLTQFSAVNGTSKDSLLTAGKLYDAVNAALRSRGQKKFLSQVKLMDFFIASQNDRNAQNAAGTTRNIDKAVKNCGRDCVGNEADRMKALKI
ncbi:hypothetical protein PCASD_05583 [Puccinia coronata f. sp. avenae]|uniref:DUF7143 domain-containing protein n=1 Tax=Puccinia coronata f. sp. avenae TaxID=200324 RepID=A0A2N5UWR3_9BASI|nr:hypothetical protein PCASD_05583 [Puccinia coronata f. sp. avenae]